MREDEDHGGDESGRDVDGTAVGNVSEFLYAGRPAVIVRTTHLQGSDEERDEHSRLPRSMREGGTPGLRP